MAGKDDGSDDVNDLDIVDVEPKDKGPVELDPEEIAVKEAEDALAKATEESETAKLEGDNETEPKQKPAQKSDKTPNEAVEPAKEHNVPIPVFNDMRKKMQSERDQRIRLEGENEALKAMHPGGDKQPAEVVLTPEDKIAELHQQKLDFAAEFDDGKLTEVEKQTKYLELEKQERDIRAEQQSANKTTIVEQSTDLAREQHEQTLYEEYPGLDMATAAQLTPLSELAQQQHLAEKGGLYPPTAQGTADLQTAVAKLFIANYGTSKPEADSGKQGDANPQLSDQAKAREAKLRQAQNHPADVSTLGTASESGTLTDEQALAQLEALKTEDEQIAFIEANPALKKLGM